MKATHSRGSLLRHEIEADFHEPIFIPHHSRCCWCGPQDHHCRLETFEVIESHRFQLVMLILLCIDVLIVILEIGVQYRLIAPAPGLDITSLAIPPDMVCADPTEVKHRWGIPKKEGAKYFRTYNEDGTLQDCCQLFHKKYEHSDIWSIGYTGNVTENINACMTLTKWTDPNNSTFGTGSSTSSTSTRRMLLSSSSSSTTSSTSSSSSVSSSSSSSSSSDGGHHRPRCYGYPGHQYSPPPGHTTAETILHWTSNTILFVFLIELVLLVYAMGPKQFFCSCQVAIHVSSPSPFFLLPSPFPSLSTLQHSPVFYFTFLPVFNTSQHMHTTITFFRRMIL